MTLHTGQALLKIATPTLIAPARPRRKFITICGHGAIAFIGGPDVSATTGALALGDRRGDQIVLPDTDDAIYGIALEVDNFPVSFIESF